MLAGSKRRELGLVFLPLCLGATQLVGGGVAVPVEAGADPSEERLRTGNTKALLQEIPDSRSDRS